MKAALDSTAYSVMDVITAMSKDVEAAKCDRYMNMNESVFIYKPSPIPVL